uniref:Uncharacterized protein n=1 Tax=Rhizophora mucronata TaxID=61149 RepID=A0A2P2Q3R9_RHIMU
MKFQQLRNQEKNQGSILFLQLTCSSHAMPICNTRTAIFMERTY